MRVRPSRQFIDRQAAGFAEFLKHEKLRGAEAHALFGLTGGEAQRLDDSSNRVQGLAHGGIGGRHGAFPWSPI
ncbi:MAG: hypothetical protein AMXMBFR7_44810 [Planctomycetota bacterium]